MGGRPRTGQNAVREMALSIAGKVDDPSLNKQSLPPATSLSEFSECILFSDFLEPLDVLEQPLARDRGRLFGRNRGGEDERGEQGGRAKIEQAHDGLYYAAPARSSTNPEKIEKP